MNTCADCETVQLNHLRRNKCDRCYQHWYKNINEDKPRCLAPGNCQLPQLGKSTLCHMHKNRQKLGMSLEIPVGLGRGAPGLIRGRRNLQGRYTNNDGYVKIRIDGRVGDSAWVLEHRYVMEQKLGRPLVKGENVHHKDGNKENNSADNLELWVSFQPNGQRPEDLLAYAYEIIERYGK